MGCWLSDILARRRNLRAHFWQTAANYIQQGFALAFGILLARLLSPAEFGEFAFITATLALSMLPSTWSLAPQVLAEISQRPSVASDALRFAWRILLLRAVCAGAGCLWLFAEAGANSAAIGVVVAVPMIFSDLLSVMGASLEGRGQFAQNFWSAVLTVLLFLGISIPAALLQAGVWALALPSIPLLIAQFLLFKQWSGLSLRPHFPPSGHSYFRAAFPLWVANTGEQAMMRADKLLLGIFSTPEALGNYNRAFNYAPLSARLLNSFLTNPTVSALANSSNGAAYKQIVWHTSLLLTCGGSLNFILWWFFAGQIVPFLFGDQWIDAVPVFEAMAPLGLVLSFAYLPTAVLLAKKRYTILAWGRTITLAIFLLVVVLASSTLDASSMAWILQGALALQGIILWLGAFAAGTQSEYE
jgi:O-antigen/teichoic acid export membrane protein